MSLIRSAALQTLSVDALVSELKSSLLFQDNSLVVLKEVWKIEGPHLCSLPKQALSVGEVCIKFTKLPFCLNGDNHVIIFIVNVIYFLAHFNGLESWYVDEF